ncbi:MULTISPECIES: CitMHS family transporter [unclassified Frigoribacterium]|jgi:CitMHS family citrate-Mg2+:H+ or citrate-Ca2+:H+ symporter|uniref:CitMHS family transporter n=1 Tax=unclassified Frigoribacterium TaxID=2627005 RepID=UPI0005BCFA2E|nr:MULTISPECIES: citrate:proton symporter [unclassified Frigoribacterium]KIU03256.1 citrate:proton symporter [Frigoribacterium sp. MEB024]KQN41357.1 citrate:proton symporter [Frigoribacterium sp. Leaf44]MBD8537835.1 citrate:proton symporter [Frigoribacterium sp. CFBP 8751]
MLVILGYLMIATFMVLIMTKRLSPMLALIMVPTIFGLFAGAGLGIGDMVIEAIGDLAPTAALLMFAIMYFGLMIDVGLFDPLVRFILRVTGNDPAKIVLGTALLAGAVSLDGDGSTTFIVTTAAMLPIYLKLGMSPVVLTCVAGLANGTLNIVPWGGPTVRAAAALNVAPSDIFVPLVPSLITGLVIVFVFAWLMGLRERRRLGTVELGGSVLAAAAEKMSPLSRELATAARGGGPGKAGVGVSMFTSPTVALGLRGGRADGSRADAPGERAVDNPGGSGGSENGAPLAGTMADTMLDPTRETLRPKLIWFNLALTVVVMVLLVLDLFPLAYVFMVGVAVALLINFPKVKQQSAEIVAHAPSIVGVVSMVFAAGVLIGVLNGTGMVDAMAQWLVQVIPNEMGPYLAVITGLLSLPLTFFMSNDAFYFGILPVLAQSAAAFGIEPVEMARASVIGQPVHLQSPLVPAILLLVSLANVNLGDHHKKVLWRAAVVSVVMLVVAIVVGVIPFG